MNTSPTKPQDEIKALCGLLAEQLERPFSDLSILQEQSYVLNALFHATLAENLDLASGKGKYREQRAQGWLKLALQIQKQCMDTAKAERAISYLDSLTTLNHRNALTTPPVPLPLNPVERTEGY